ncbi:MAG TPA: sigma-54 dependent transcriptional regulator [Candidatus Acidoferrales bacterium]|jgi:DNA-binding NtrC family response regulator|nr:sigma-54 dependent transcriptional regulator [Candidatus Acidoferrales bacterium]
MASTALERLTPGASRVLITSPNDEFRAKVCDQLSSESCLVDEATGGAAALTQAEEYSYATILLDRRLIDLHAEEVAAILRRRQPNVRVVFVDSEDHVEAAELLPSEPRPPGTEPGRNASKSLSPQDRPATAVAASTERATESLPGMYSADRAMQEVFRMARLVAPRDTSVLITGETGTGKELVANAIHQLSGRRNGAFVVVNCAAIPEELLESELFGHTRGAFTGAIQSRLGRIHASHGGTLFLDEVGDLPLSMQAKLLRFLQHGEVQRLGSPDIFKVDVRIVAATNADLKQHVAQKEFRRDLYYRLAVFPIQLPSLATRRDDIVPLADYFIEKLCGSTGIPRKSLTSGAAALLQRYGWPGNVRELEHVIERAFILSEDRAELSADLFQQSLEG